MKSKNNKLKDQFANYAPEGISSCEMKCDRKVVMTKEGPVIICNGCMRIVMDNRNKD